MHPLHQAHQARLRMREKAVADHEERVSILHAQLSQADAELSRAFDNIDANFGREVARLIEAAGAVSAIVDTFPESDTLAALGDELVAAMVDPEAPTPVTDAVLDEDESAPVSERRPRGWKNTLHALGWSDADRDTLPAAAVRVICRERLRKGERSVADIAAK